MNITEAVQNAFNDSEISEMIKEKVETLSNEKAQRIAENYIDILEKEADKYLQKKVDRITENVSSIVEETVKMFVNKYKGAFTNYKNTIKSEAILESLVNVCKLAGVNAEMITEEVHDISTKNERVLKSKISCLERLINEEQNSSKTLKKQHESDIENLKDEISEKEKEIQRLNDKLKEKELENDEITEEKNNIAKLGIIAELKQGLSLSESREFEKNAINIPFSLDKSYVDKLNTLKESITEKSLNEVTDNNVDENNDEDFYMNKYI